METKHTAGPWHRNIPPATKYTTIFAGRNAHVCHLHVSGHPDEQVEANAKLIAAAPDLLKELDSRTKLLKKILFAMENEKDIEEILGWRPTMRAAIESSDKTIRKATN